MSDISSLVLESLHSSEFGPFYDWLEEHGCPHLKARLQEMLGAGEVEWVTSEYLSRISTVKSLRVLEAKAEEGKSLLGRRT